jgi:CheY-like chemotaxis protein
MRMTASTMVAVKTIVVADDTAFVRDRFTSALEEAGHEALGARSWPELTSIVRRVGDRLDLIALDLRLPQGIGTGMVRALRSAVPAKTPIVVFSGTIANAVEVRDLTTLGVAGYLNEYAAVQHILPSLAPHLFPEHYQRRLSPRVSLAIPVAYRVGNTITSAVTVNISLRGLGIRTVSPLEIGTAPYELLLRVPGIGPRTARTLVAHRHRVVIRGISDLKRLGVDTVRAASFLSLRGKRLASQPTPEQLNLFPPGGHLTQGPFNTVVPPCAYR